MPQFITLYLNTLTGKPKKTYLLAIESATSICGAALFEGDKLLSETAVYSPRRHNEILAVMVDELLLDNAIRFDNITKIAVSIGPGSFTGLRVGLSFAKGVALGTGCQIVPVSTLQALALTIYLHSLQSKKNESDRKIVFASTVARKNESFGSLFEFKARDAYPVDISKTRLYKHEDLQLLMNEEIMIGGEGVDFLLSNFSVQLKHNGCILSWIRASAFSVGCIALYSVKNGDSNYDAFSLEPMYINEFTVYKR